MEMRVLRCAIKVFRDHFCLVSDVSAVSFGYRAISRDRHTVAFRQLIICNFDDCSAIIHVLDYVTQVSQVLSAIFLCFFIYFFALVPIKRHDKSFIKFIICIWYTDVREIVSDCMIISINLCLLFYMKIIISNIL